MSKERADSIIGDLAEIAPQKGIGWFWFSLSQIILFLAWRSVALLMKEVSMSKPKFVVSLVTGLTLIAAGWWAAKTYFMPPPAYSTRMIAYGVARQTVGGPVIGLRLGDGRNASDLDPIKGPVPVSMPAPPYIAKKNKVKGEVEALLDLDASGSVAGVTAIHSSSVDDVEFVKGVLHTAQTWKFKPAMEKGESVPARVIVQVRF